MAKCEEDTALSSEIDSSRRICIERSIYDLNAALGFLTFRLQQITMTDKERAVMYNGMGRRFMLDLDYRYKLEDEQERMEEWRSAGDHRRPTKGTK